MEDLFGKRYCCEDLSKEMLELWLTYLKSEEKIEQTQRLLNSVIPFFAIPTTVVQIIFHVCEEFEQPPDVRYLTVELFDRFINNQFLMLAPKMWPDENTIFENSSWKAISSRIKEQSLLRVMSCLALASKFVVYNKVIPLRKIHEFLCRCGITFSIKTIRASEMRVYKTLDYKLHFPTVLTHTNLLIQLIDFPKNIEMKLFHELKVKIIDLTYIYHQEIFHKLFYYSTGRWEKTYEERKEFLATECNNIFLGAAVIVTTIMFVQPKESHGATLSTQIALTLDNLTDIPSDDIIALASIITMMVLN